MRATRVDTVPRTAANKKLNALAAFAAGMLIAFAAALLYVQVQSRNSVQAANVTRLERPAVQGSELNANTLAKQPAGSVAQVPEREPKASAEAASEPSKFDAPAAIASDTNEIRPVSAGPATANAEFVSRPSVVARPEPAHFAEMPTREHLAVIPSSPQAGDHTAAVLPPPSSIQPPVTPPDANSRMPQQPAVAEARAPERPVQTSSGAAPNSVLPEAKPQEAKPKIITVQSGTVIPVRLSETLSSDRNRTGDTFRATLAAPIVVNGEVLAPTGSTVLGRVVNARKAPLLGGTSELTLNITEITGTDGKLMSVNTGLYSEQGSRSTITNTAKMTTGAAVGAVVGALTGAAEGAGIASALKDHDRTNGFMATKRIVVLPAGTEADFALATPIQFPG